MARSVTSVLGNALAADEINPIMLVEGLFDSGAERFWTGIGTLPWNGQAWTGAGDFIGFSGITETGALRAEGMTVALSGIPAASISIALNEEYQGRTVRVYLGALDGNGAVIADPYEVVNGLADTMPVTDGGDTATIALTVESELIALQRANKQLYTSERQQIDYPADLGLDFVPALQDAQTQFGGG